MNPFSRLWITVKAKFNRLVNKVEDPAAQLDYAYEKMKEELGQVREAVVKLRTQQSKLESLRKKRMAEALKMKQGAELSLREGDEDQARQFLERKNILDADLLRLDQDIAAMKRESETMKAQKQKLETQIEVFRSNKEITKAQLDAAEATIAVGKATSSIGGAADSAGAIMERANELVENKRAEADAITQLEEEGVFSNSLTGETGLERKVHELASASDVEADLAKLKAEMGISETTSSDVVAEEQESDVAAASDAS